MAHPLGPEVLAPPVMRQQFARLVAAPVVRGAGEAGPGGAGFDVGQEELGVGAGRVRARARRVAAVLQRENRHLQTE